MPPKAAPINGPPMPDDEWTVNFRATDSNQWTLTTKKTVTVGEILRQLSDNSVMKPTYRVPKKLEYNGKDLLENWGTTLESIGFSSGDVIEYIEYPGEELYQVLFERCRELKQFNCASAQSSINIAKEKKDAQLKANESKGTFQDFTAALGNTEIGVEVIMSIMCRCPGYAAGATLPKGPFVTKVFNAEDASKDVSALVPVVCLNRLDVLKAILNLGIADVINASCDTQNRSPLHYAVQFGGDDMVDFLVNTGMAKVNKQDDAGISPIALAASLGKTAELKIMMERGVDRLKEDEADTTAGPGGKSLLMLAAENGKTDTVLYLLDKPQTRIGHASSDGKTAVHLAAKAGYLSTVNKLLMWNRGTDKGADINAVDNNNQTALHLAALSGRVEVVAELYNNGQGIRVDLLDGPNKDNHSALSLATNNGHVNVVQKLLELTSTPSRNLLV